MNTKHFSQILIAILLTMTIVSPVSVRADSAEVLFVKPGGMSTGLCDSWANACKLQYALTSAVAGQDIWVAAGVYKPASGEQRWVSFQLKSGVEMYGGFAGYEDSLGQRDWQTNVTILSGDIDNNDTDANGNSIAESAGDIQGNNACHVVVGVGVDGTAVLDGFTITAGQANDYYPYGNGGGMYNEGGQPTLKNIVFSGNMAWQGGGMYNSNSSPNLTNVVFTGGVTTFNGAGMYNISFSNPVLNNVTFSNNRTAWFGGGMTNVSSDPTLTNVSFANNQAKWGGGMANSASHPALTQVTFLQNAASDMGGGMYNAGNPTLTDVAFIGNTAVGGGGMYNYSGSHPTLINVTFRDNQAGQGGGMDNQLASPTLIDVTFSGNSAVEIGGGMLNQANAPVLTNVTFSGNSATYGGGMGNNQFVNALLTNVTFSGNSAIYGGGMINVQGCQPTLTNVTFSGNTATLGGGLHNWGGSHPQIHDTLFWGNTASSDGAQIYDNTAEFSSSFVKDSVVEGGCPAGSVCENILTGDPMLGPLGDHGGLTRTIPLFAGSSAIDTGNDATCAATDQRGVARPQGSHCDMGAFEYEPPPNTPPAITSLAAPAAPVQLGQSINATVEFDDPDAGDTHTVTWDWGDGSSMTAPALLPSSTASHVYTSPGVYAISATITDASGESATATFQYVVIYDPSGGFVTGGGWIHSPPGAYLPNPSLSGKATFGFVAKYQKGASLPDGSTEFQFQTAGFRFTSTSYQWLVVAGSKAQFKGLGTLNDTGSYGFLLTAVDGQPDRFRIKIWDVASGAMLYDNMLDAATDELPMEIGAGAIVIHK